MPKSSRKPTRKRPASRSKTVSVVEHVRVVVYQDADAWLAHCLEFDLVAQGDTRAEALQGINNSIDVMFEYAREHDDAQLLFRPAAPEFWEMFERAKMKAKAGGAAPRLRPEMELVTA